MSTRWLLLSACCAGAVLAPAQASGASDNQRSPLTLRISLVISGAANLGTMGKDVEAALRRSGLDDDTCPMDNPLAAPCDNEETPEVSHGRYGYGVALSYALNPVWEFRSLASAEEELHSYGVSRAAYRVQLSLDARSSRYAMLAVYRPWASLVRLGAGPAFYNAEVRGSGDYTRFSDNAGSRLGVVLDAGLAFPRRSRLFADLGVQYWHGGDVRYGPYDLRNGIGNVQVHFPERTFSMNRTVAGIGIGFRM